MFGLVIYIKTQSHPPMLTHSFLGHNSNYIYSVSILKVLNANIYM